MVRKSTKLCIINHLLEGGKGSGHHKHKGRDATNQRGGSTPSAERFVTPDKSADPYHNREFVLDSSGRHLPAGTENHNI